MIGRVKEKRAQERSSSLSVNKTGTGVPRAPGAPDPHNSP